MNEATQDLYMNHVLAGIDGAGVGAESRDGMLAHVASELRVEASNIQALIDNGGVGADLIDIIASLLYEVGVLAALDGAGEFG